MSTTLPEPRASRAWSIYFPIQYRLIRLLDPIIRTWWRGYGLGNVVELRLRGRRTGLDRRVLVGLMRASDGWYVGHPNGDTAWTRNLEAARDVELSLSWPSSLTVHARRLEPGPERDRAILATGQQVFPGNIVYRLARRHVLAVGTYFALEASAPTPADTSDVARSAPREAT
jgi:hypothetical protein